MKKLVCLILATFMVMLVGCNKVTNSLSQHLSTTYPGDEFVYYNTSIVGTLEDDASSNDGAGVSSNKSKPESSTPSNVKDNPSNNPSNSNPSDIDISSPVNNGSPLRPSGNATYYNYEQLNTSQKHIYNLISDAAYKMTEGMIELGDTTTRDISIAYRAVRNDMPEYFWLPTTFVARQVTNGSSVSYSIALHNGTDVTYLCTKQERAVMEQKLKEKLDKVRSLIPSGVTDYEAEKIVHDWLCENIVYTKNQTDSKHIYNAYGALVDGFALCEGYSRAMQLICNNLSIPCTLVMGTGNGEPHMWNIIKIGGQWYHLDVTWDDCGFNLDNGIKYYTMHSYFNLTDTDIKTTHTIDRDVSQVADSEFEGQNTDPDYNISVPTCNSQKFNYKTNENIVLPPPEEKDKATQIILSQLKKAVKEQKNFCELYLGFKPGSNMDANTLSQKYDLQKCISEVNSKNNNKIATHSIMLSLDNQNFILFFKYEEK